MTGRVFGQAGSRDSKKRSLASSKMRHDDFKLFSNALKLLVFQKNKKTASNSG